MPYIKQADRDRLERGAPPRTPGELNYVLTKHLLNLTDNSDARLIPSALANEVELYVKRKDPSYDLYNEVIGVLECCRMEWERRASDSSWRARRLGSADALRDVSRQFYAKVVVPYENDKIQQNGDIYS